MSVWSVDLCNGFDKIAEAEGEFHGVERWLEAGSWSFGCAPGLIDWSAGSGVDDVDSVRLFRDSDVAFAGFVGAESEGSGGLERVIDAAGERHVWSGPDLWDLFRRRIGFPDPLSTTWSVSHDVRAGPASSVLASYLFDNAGAGATATREIPGFFVVDQSEGIVDEWTVRLAPLSDVITRICRDAELTCRIVMNSSGQFIATIGRPRNLSDRIVISDQGDFTQINMRRVPPTTTFTVAGGQGEGVARMFAIADSGAIGLNRREAFSDQASLVSPGELQLSAEATTRFGGESWAVSAELTDDTAGRLQYGRDIIVGDQISIEVDNVRHVVPVTSAEFIIGPTRQVVLPKLGTAAPDLLRGMIRDVANLGARFDRDIA